MGTNRLKLCLKPFFLSRMSEVTCVSSLFFDLPAAVLKLCPQEMVILLEELTADCLDDSTYLNTVRSSVYKFFIFTQRLQQTGRPVSGSQIRLRRPPCDGRPEKEPLFCSCFLQPIQNRGLASRLGFSEIDAGEAVASFSSKIELKLGGAPRGCEASTRKEPDLGEESVLSPLGEKSVLSSTENRSLVNGRTSY